MFRFSICSFLLDAMFIYTQNNLFWFKRFLLYHLLIVINFYFTTMDAMFIYAQNNLFWFKLFLLYHLLIVINFNSTTIPLLLCPCGTLRHIIHIPAYIATKYDSGVKSKMFIWLLISRKLYYVK